VKSNPAVAGVLALALLALLAAGCEPIDASKGGSFTTPEALLAAHEKAWNERDYTAYEALLDDEFEFYPCQEDADDLPWMTGESWSRGVELGMVANMFDPDFTGGNGSVELVEFHAVEQSRKEFEDQRIEVTCSVQGRVMWTPADGVIFDTRMVFGIVDRDGGLLIDEIVEIQRAVGRASTRSEDPLMFASLGRIKSSYR
jgi:hypothetical protein